MFLKGWLMVTKQKQGHNSTPGLFSVQSLAVFLLLFAKGEMTALLHLFMKVQHKTNEQNSRGWYP